MYSKQRLDASEFNATDHGEKTDKYVGMTGAQIFHEMMREHAVEKIFGYPGGGYTSGVRCDS